MAVTAALLRSARGRMLLIGAGVLAISIAAFFRVPLLPEMGAELGMSATQLGLVTTAFALGRLVSDIPAGRLASRVPAVVMLAAAALVLAVGSILLAGAAAAGWAIGAAFVLGIASAVANTTGMTFFSTSARLERRGIAMAAFSSALLGGQALGPLVGGALGELAGWRGAVTAAAGIGLAVSIGLLLVSRRWPSAPQGRSTVDEGTAGGADGLSGRGTGGGQGAAGGGRIHVTTAERVALQSVSFVMFFTLGALPQTLVPLIGSAEFGLSAATIGAALGLGGLCRFLGGLFGGFVSDRVARRAALIPGLLAQAAGVALLVTPSVVGWLAAIVVMSLASWGISVAATVIADRAPAEDVGSLLGTYRFVGDLGLIAGPLITTGLYERVGKPPAVLLVSALLVASALACALIVPETRWSGRREPGSR